MDSSKKITITVAIVLALVHLSSAKVCHGKTTESTKPTVLCKCVAPDKCPILNKENCNGTILPPGPPCYCCPKCDPLPPAVTTPVFTNPSQCLFVCTQETLSQCPDVSPETCTGTYRAAGGITCDCCARCIT